MARAMPLRVQLLLLQALIVVITVSGTGILAGTLQERAIRESYQDRMQAVALSVARLPAIKDAFDDAHPEDTIAPIAEVIRKASDVTYVVVTDADGIRYSHPNADLIGRRVSTDPSVPLSGKVYVGTQTGTLGSSWRVKVPIFSSGQVVGTASVGILESHLAADFGEKLGWLAAAIAASSIVGFFGAAWVTSIIRARTYRLEPQEIASLVRNRETTLHGLSEGLVIVDARGVITLLNDAAQRLLGIDPADAVGRPAADVLTADVVGVLEGGEAEGAPIVVGDRVLIARSTGSRVSVEERPTTRRAGEGVEAVLLLRDHTELHAMLNRLEAADAILATRRRGGIPKGLSAETLDTVTAALRAAPDSSASELAASTGLSRVSTRRYLEHLAANGLATRALDYTTAGRPGTRYRALDPDLEARVEAPTASVT